MNCLTFQKTLRNNNLSHEQMKVLDFLNFQLKIWNLPLTTIATVSKTTDG